MKYLYLFFVIISVCRFSSLEAQELNLVYSTEFQHNLHGKANWVNLLTVKGTWPTENAGLWKDGSFDLATISVFRSSKERIVDDMQVFSNIDEHTLLVNLFIAGYTHRINRIRMFLGVRNMNEDYFNIPYSSLFTNSSCGVYPTISCNYICANYPLSAMCFFSEVKITNQLTYTNSLYNGVAYDIWHDGCKLFSINPKRDGVMNVGELAFSTGVQYQSRYHLGGLFHTGHLNPEENNRRMPFNYVGWLLAEQDVYVGEKEKIGLLAQASFAPENKNYCYSYIGAGLVAYGLFSASKKDKLGLMVNSAQFADMRETTAELTWSVPVSKYMVLQPAFHWIQTGEDIYTIGMLRAVFNIGFPRK